MLDFMYVYCNEVANFHQWFNFKELKGLCEWKFEKMSLSNTKIIFNEKILQNSAIFCQ